MRSRVTQAKRKNYLKNMYGKRGRSAMRTPSRGRSRVRSRPPTYSGKKARTGSSGSLAKRFGRSLSRRIRTGKWSVSRSPQAQSDFSYSGGSISYQYFKFGKKYSKFQGKAGAPILYQLNQDQVATAAAAGNQVLLFSGPLMGRSDMQGCQLVAFNAEKLAVGNTVSTTNNANNRCFVKSVSSEWRVENLSVKPIEIEIYDYVMKRDTIDGPATIVGSDWGLEAQGNIVGGGVGYQALTYNLPGWVPQDNSTFNNHVKIIKRKKVWLQAGETHTHVMNAVYNKQIDPALWLTTASGVNNGNNYYKGWTFGCFAIGKSGLYHGSTSGYDMHRATIGAYQITRYHLRPVTLNAAYVQQQSSITATVGNERIVDEVIGQIVEAGVGIIAGGLNNV
jgi:hypothetical protein